MQTLTRFLMDEQRRGDVAPGCVALLDDVKSACKRIAFIAGQGRLGTATGSAGSRNVQGEVQTQLDVVANEIFIRSTERGGHLAGLLSEEMAEILPLPTATLKDRYLLLFDPLDGSSNADVNGSVGSIFSVLKCPDDVSVPVPEHFLQPGSRQICAGYALYGVTTMLVLTTGNGVNGFTFDRELREFILTHPKLKIPADTAEFAINASNSRHWEPAVQRYVRECMAGTSGTRERDFNMRWVGALVGEAHRILLRGGIYLYPRDRKDPAVAGRLRLLYETNPIGLLIEQAGGRASTGVEAMLHVMPQSLHQRIGFVFGASAEVERIERYYRDHNEFELDAPLFGARTLFRAPA